MIGNLKISEDFYSIQGEGISSGVPAYFIRLGSCNFICGGPDGKWMKEGKATWWCFPKNTLVNTPNGLKKISTLKIGDPVYSYNENTGAIELDEVENNLERKVDPGELLRINLDIGNQGVIKTTKEHPFYVKNKGWVEAKDLNPGDILFYSRHQLKSRMDSDRMKINNPSFDPENVKKSQKNRFNGMSGLETWYNSFFNKNKLGLKYTGNNKLAIGDKDRKYRFPDFKVDGEKKLIEIYDTTMKYAKGYRDKDWEQMTREHYQLFGYDVMFLTELDKKDPNLLEKINNYLYNGIEILDISPLSQVSLGQYKYHGDLDEDGFTVSNLSVKNNHNFFVSGVLVHNCDTEHQWRKSTERDYHYLIDRWKDQGIYDRILDGRIHLVWTGGEPTMVKHQTGISGFMNLLYDIVGDTGNKPFAEIETNGSIFIKDELFDVVDQINCSPKLANSGLPAKRRIREVALKRIMQHDNYQFKFVVSSEEDIQEIIRDFVEPFKIDSRKVVLMPALDDQNDFHEMTRFSMEMAKKYGFLGLTRLHISAWDKTTGV